MKADAIIVGGGPAGSAAALTLARKGVRVLLAERSDMPREKACGDALVPRAVGLLRDLGIKLQGPRVHGVRFRSTDDFGISTSIAYGDAAGTAVRRSVLDQILIAAAEAAGARVQLKTNVENLIMCGDGIHGVRFRTPGGASEVALAPVTILASGSSSPLAKRAPTQRDLNHVTGMAVTRYLDEVDFEGPLEFEVFLPVSAGDKPVAGYGWVFPTGEGGANIGVGHFAQGSDRVNLREVFDDFQRVLFLHDKRFQKALPVGTPLEAPAQSGGSGAAACGKGILLVGDAAGLIRPLLAEGVSGALESGIAAANACAEHLSSDGSLNPYSAALRDSGLDHTEINHDLQVIYSNIRHFSRDIVEFLDQQTPLTKATVAAVMTPQSKIASDPMPPHQAANYSARIAKIRATEIAGAGHFQVKPILRELNSCADTDIPAAETFFSTLASTQHSLADAMTLRIGICLELMVITVLLLDGVEGRKTRNRSSRSRGGGWLSSSLSLALADRTMARFFAENAKLPRLSRQATSLALTETLESIISIDDSTSQRIHRCRRAIVLTSARTAVRILPANEEKRSRALNELNLRPGATAGPLVSPISSARKPNT